MATSRLMDKSLPIGFMLVDHFQVEGVLGQGGFGTTYLALDTQLDCPVAIKEYNPDFATRQTNYTIAPATESDRDSYQWGYNSFLREAQLLARFHHPNIVKVRHIFKAYETAYIVMDYEQGKSLLDCFRERGRIVQAQELLRIVQPVIEGLKTVHEREFLHRDIKPHNIFIRDDGTPLLLDFGSARIQGTDATHTVTPGYTPIEQFEDEGYEGPFTDIYSIGATLYHIITGRPPVSALKRQTGIVLNGADPYVPLSDEDVRGPGAQALVRAINSALKQDAESRPQSLGEWNLRGAGQVAPAAPSTVRIEPEAPTVFYTAPSIANAVVKQNRAGAWIGGLAGLGCLAVGAIWVIKSGLVDISATEPAATGADVTYEVLPIANLPVTPADGSEPSDRVGDEKAKTKTDLTTVESSEPATTPTNLPPLNPGADASNGSGSGRCKRRRPRYNGYYQGP